MLTDKELTRIVEMANHAGIFAFTQGLLELTRAASGSEERDYKRYCYHYHTLYASTQGAVDRLIPLFEHCYSALKQRSGSRAAATAVTA
jgi:hypothetical protein